MSIDVALLWLAMIGIVLIPAIASLTCWFRATTRSRTRRAFSSAHGLLFLATVGAAQLASPFTAQHEAFVLPFLILVGCSAVVGVASVLAAFVTHRSSPVALVLLVLAFPIEAYLSLLSLSAVANFQLRLV